MENEAPDRGSDRPVSGRSRGSWLDWLLGASTPLLTLLFAGRIGTFPGGAESTSVWVAFVVASSLAFAGAWRAGLDPLGWLHQERITPRWRGAPWLLALMPFAVVGLVLLSRELSPVPRAGLLWPSSLLLGVLAIPAVAWTLDRPARRVAARWGVAVSILGVAIWALLDWFGGSPRPAAPLGHHNLLAAWLVVLWPLALLPGRLSLREGTSRGVDGLERRTDSARLGGLRQMTDGVVLAALALALLASRSLAGNLAFGVQLLWTARASTAPGRARRILHFGLLGLAMVLAVGWRRLGTLFSGGLDGSFAARWDYAVAAWSGWLQRPLVGWGPGSSAWTLHLHLEGSRLAPGQVVTDAHVLTLDLLYEWGLIAGLAGAVLLLWSWPTRAPRGNRADVPADGGWRAASTASLVGLAALSCGAGFFDVTALWVSLPLVLGARLAVTCGVEVFPVGAPTIVQRMVAIALVLLALWPALAPLRAHRLEELASSGAGPSSSNPTELLDRAAGLDAEHPRIAMALARSHWPIETAAGVGSDARRTVELALQGAETAMGLAPLHLEAGARYAAWSMVDSDAASIADLRPRALSALEAACDLAPRDGLAPFLRATLEEPSPARSLLAFLVRGLLAEPRLLVTPELLARPDLRRAAVDLVAAMPEIPVGWRAALVEAEEGLPDLPAPVLEARRLEAVINELGETSLSLFAFRRTGEPTVIAWVPVDVGRLDFDIPPVYVLPEVRRPGSLPFEVGCRLTLGSGTPSPAMLARSVTAEDRIYGR